MVHVSSLPKVARRHEDKKNAILREGMRICVSEGLHALNVHGLTAALDLSPGALYRYFPSIEALLAELEVQALLTLESKMIQQSYTHALSPFFGLARLYLRAPENVLVRRMLGDPRPLVSMEAAGPALMVAARLMQHVTALFTKAGAALSPGDAQQRALVLWAATHGVSQMDKLTRFDAQVLDVHTLADATVSALLQGWGAKTAAVTKAREEIPW